MVKAFTYLRTSADDGREKSGIGVQRDACAAYAASEGFEIVHEYVDDGVSGRIPMHTRAQGKLLIAALLANEVKSVLVYDSKRVGRTQPAFWSFIGMARDNGVAVLDANGTDLCESVQGGIGGLMAEMDRNQTVARLAAGKAIWRGQRRVDGRWPFGMHPHHDYDGERATVTRITAWHVKGMTNYRIARTLNAEGVKTRYGSPFTVSRITEILNRKEERHYV